METTAQTRAAADLKIATERYSAMIGRFVPATGKYVQLAPEGEVKAAYIAMLKAEHAVALAYGDLECAESLGYAIEIEER